MSGSLLRARDHHYFDVGEMGIEHALLPEKGLVVAGDVVIGADSHTCTYGALEPFHRCGQHGYAAGMATGKAWFKVPAALKFHLTGSLPKWVSGKDVILHIIGMIGVDGALYKSMNLRETESPAFPWMTALRLPIWPLRQGERTVFSRWMKRQKSI